MHKYGRPVTTGTVAPILASTFVPCIANFIVIQPSLSLVFLFSFVVFAVVGILRRAAVDKFSSLCVIAASFCALMVLALACDVPWHVAGAWASEFEVPWGPPDTGTCGKSVATDSPARAAACSGHNMITRLL